MIDPFAFPARLPALPVPVRRAPRARRSLIRPGGVVALRSAVAVCAVGVLAATLPAPPMPIGAVAVVACALAVPLVAVASVSLATAGAVAVACLIAAPLWR